MKLFKNILIAMIALVFATACDEGIDSITVMEPGVDETAPVITINYPTEGTTIKVIELITSIDIDLKVTDDIEIGSISVLIDGTEIANFNSFTDYRIAIEKFTYDSVTTGAHIMTVIATDLEDKSTTSSVNFTKEPPYTPLFEGELFYMPFDGDYYELVNIVQATKVGYPGFAGESILGTDSYSGTTDSYLSYPIASLLTPEFTAAFWYKVNPSPDRAGILVIGNDIPENRNQGFRLFREGNGAEQRIKLNVGTGDAEVWNDGGIIDVAAGEWVHVAFTISQTQCTIFLNGVEMNSAPMDAGIDWTACETLTIGAGGETFSYWDHKADASAIDELRLFNKALTASEIQNMINVTNPYEPTYGETFYMPFDGDYADLISSEEATIVGTTGFAGESAIGSDAFTNTTDSYLTFPIEDIIGDEFSTVFWYKVNPSPDRAGILVIGDDIDDRNQGFRLFREGDASSQRIKLNIGTGETEVWNDGGVIDVAADEWIQIAVTVSLTKNTIYFNGVEMLSSDLSAGIDWTGCTTLTIGAGGETFSYWDHLSDSSFLDELRMFNKALTQEEIQTIYDAEK